MNTKAIIPVALCAFIICSCNKQDDFVPDSPFHFEQSGEIVLSIESPGIEPGLETKVVPLDEAVPSSLYLSRTTGVWKSETLKNVSESMTVTKSSIGSSSGTISTGWYQSATASAYNYYVSNKDIVFTAGGSIIVPTNDADVVAGCTQAATGSTSPSVTLEHVFARTGSLTCNAQSGYTISNVSWTIKSNSGSTGGTTGTYNIATKSWSDVTALSEQAITSSTNLYCNPGVYTLTVSYTLSIGDDYSKSFTKSGNVTLTAGKVNNIICTAIGGDAQSVSLSVSLTSWSDETVNLLLS